MLALAAAVLSGCSSEQPANDTLPDASASTSAPTEALPPLGPPEFPVPDAAREKTPGGALEFTRYYIGLSAHIATGAVNPQVLLDLSDGCGFCRRVAMSYEEDRTAGLTYEGFEYTFEEYGLPVLDGAVAEIGFAYSQSSYEVVDRHGQSLPDRAVEATGDLQSGAHLVWRDDISTWLVTSMTIG
ncbi:MULTISPECIES: hypothetical protein [unclassified Blastococcus]